MSFYILYLLHKTWIRHVLRVSGCLLNYLEYPRRPSSCLATVMFRGTPLTLQVVLLLSCFVGHP